ncbi:MAG: hypothetical protein ACUVQ0_05930 [Thermoproteota archaeon]
MKASPALDGHGASQVIETVIVTAVGIVVAITVMLWITGLIGGSIRYEDVEIISQFCTLEDDVFRIRVKVRNRGSYAGIDGALVNNAPIESIHGTSVSWSTEDGRSGEKLPIPLNTGVNVDIVFEIPNGAEYPGGVLKSGMTAMFRLHSTSGIDCSFQTNLP